MGDVREHASWGWPFSKDMRLWGWHGVGLGGTHEGHRLCGACKALKGSLLSLSEKKCRGMVLSRERGNVTELTCDRDHSGFWVQKTVEGQGAGDQSESCCSGPGEK